MSKITWRTRKYQIGERKRWKRPLLRLSIFEFEQNIRKSLFLPAVYTPFEINSIPAILGIKVSDKNFQPTFDHKKKKKDRREAFETDETGTFFGFSSKPFHQWGIQWILKNDKRIETRMRRKLPGYR